MFWLLRIGILLGLLASSGTTFAAVTQETLVNGQNYSVTNPGNQAVPLRIGAGADNSADASYKLGVLPCVVDNTYTWTAGRMVPCVVNTSGALVTTATIGGTTTPSDAFANPTNAGIAWTLFGVFNGTTWDRLREPTGDAMAVTGLPAAANMGWNGASWDRLQVDASKFLKVNVAAALPAGSNVLGAVRIGTYSYLNIVLKATTIVKASSGVLHAIVINNPTGTWTAQICDNAANCTSGTLATISPTTSVSPVTLIYDLSFTTGLTIVTAGTTMGDITVVYN